MRGVVSLQSLSEPAFQSEAMQQSLLQQHAMRQEKEVVCARCTSKRLVISSLVCVFLGLLLLLLSTYLPSVIQSKLDDGIREFTSIDPQAYADQTDGFKQWQDWSVPDAVAVYQHIYMFNVTNPAEILAGGQPAVTQHGPYVYRQFKKKFDISYMEDVDNKQVVQFKEWVYWEYQWTMSAPGLNPFSDRYTVPNLPFQAVMSVLRNSVPTQADFESMYALIQGVCALGGTDYTPDAAKLFTSLPTVNQWLFGFGGEGGCVAQFIPGSGLTASGFPGLLGPNLGPANTTQEAVGAATPFDALYTGSDDASLARSYVQWKGQQYLNVSYGVAPNTVTKPIWGDAQANRVYGSIGLKWPGHIEKGATVTAWVDEMMRHCPLLNAGEETVQVHGIELLRFILDPRLLLNSTQNPANGAYYSTRFNGLQDVSLAKQTLPIFMSKPHFLDADKDVQNDVRGMHPVRAEHDTFIDVEPLSGVTMQAQKRLQINLNIQPWEFVQPPNSTSTFPRSWYTNTSSGALGQHFLPVAWVDERAEITSGKASEFRRKVYGAQGAVKYLRLLGGIFGAALIVAATHMFVVARSRALREGEEQQGPHVTVYNH